jgi:hypothetical protein
VDDQVDQRGYKRGDYSPSELAPLTYFCFLGIRGVLLGFQPCLFFGLVQGFYVCHLRCDFYVAKAAAEKLFDELRWIQAEDGSYAGTFVKDEKAVEVVAATGPMLFCNAIIEFYGIGVEITPAKSEPKVIRGKKE